MSELARALAAPDGPSLRRLTPPRQRRLLDFFLVLAVCNSVVVSLEPPPTPASTPPAKQQRESKDGDNRLGKGWMRRQFLRKKAAGPLAGTNASSAPASSPSTPELPPSPTLSTPASSMAATPAPEPCRHSDSDLLRAYVAESPDEAALVRAACQHGCKLVQRDAESCLVWLPGDGHVRLQVLHVLPFDAERKRMSVLVRDPATGRPLLLTKGADCALLNRLRAPDSDDTDSDRDRVVLHTRLHLEQYAVTGLRTLCLAARYLDDVEYANWLAELHAAERCIAGREVAVGLAVDRLEVELELLGATGVEDRLQEGAADTVAALREAGIGVWVLTGDKQETAVQVGHACRLLTEGQRLLVLNADSPADAGDRVRRWLRELDVTYDPAYQIRQRRERPAVREGVALALDGRSLRHCLEEPVRYDFLLLAEQCSSVLCCRTTPSQKAAVVRLVKEGLGMQTLAIGDGANDVSMIQTADIGIGISGQEGMQAVMAADFALARFCFLKKLLLVHGHWCYDRLARMSLYLFYKNCVYIMMLFWFQLFNGFSGQVNIGQVYQICFNLTMTSLGPLVIGILDRHLSAEILLANPVLYMDAQNCRSYLPWHFWLNILDAVWQSIVVYFVAYLGVVDTDCDIWSFGDIVVSAGVITAVAHNALEVRGWTGLHWFALLGSPLVAWFAFAIVLNLMCTNCLHPDNPYYVIVRGITTARFWLPQLLAPVLALTPRLCVRAFHNSTRGGLTVQALRLQAGGVWRLDHRLPLRTPPRLFPGPPPAAAAATAAAAAARSHSLSFLVCGGGGGGGGGVRVRGRSASAAAATGAAGSGVGAGGSTGWWRHGWEVSSAPVSASRQRRSRSSGGPAPAAPAPAAAAATTSEESAATAGGDFDSGGAAPCVTTRC